METRTVTRSVVAVAPLAPVAAPLVAAPVIAVPAPVASPTSARADEAVNPAIRELLVIFAEALAGVSFPDVDGKALAVQAAQVEERAAEVRRLEATLDDARRRLAEAHEALAVRAQRAMAYARVFADGDAALSARLEGLALPRVRGARTVTAAATTPASDGAPRRRGRPPKSAAPVLFDERAAAVT